ncbi:hypothetical protein KCP75_22190 [Salmonella enterica subsp. enterica]|nr:hypothetical protein KCP75_22190 [Salmonella enterica subsp. enterica]
MASARHLRTRCCATVNRRQTTDKTKGPVFRQGPFVYLMRNSSYTRVGRPTLPSALRRFTSEFGMGSVGPRANCRRANSLPETGLLHRCCVGCIRKVSHILLYHSLAICRLARRKIFRSRKSGISAEKSSHPPKHLRRCKG